jgi:hypothetical protein
LVRLTASDNDTERDKLREKEMERLHVSVADDVTEYSVESLRVDVLVSITDDDEVFDGLVVGVGVGGGVPVNDCVFSFVRLSVTVVVTEGVKVPEGEKSTSLGVFVAVSERVPIKDEDLVAVRVRLPESENVFSLDGETDDISESDCERDMLVDRIVVGVGDRVREEVSDVVSVTVMFALDEREVVLVAVRGLLGVKLRVVEGDADKSDVVVTLRLNELRKELDALCDIVGGVVSVGEVVFVTSADADTVADV